jgi:hypothetical protein
MENIGKALEDIAISFKLWEIDVSFNLSINTFIITIIAVSAIMILFGINAVGSGLNDRGSSTAVKAITLIICYVVLWLFSSQYIYKIPIYASTINIIFMIIYMLYFFTKLAELE